MTTRRRGLGGRTVSAELHWLWDRLNANYWFYPALFAIGGGLLAGAMIWIDQHGMADWLNRVPEIAPARPAGASNMLNVIATSMIGIASTVFSITIAAVAYASGTYGPRLLTNFMEDKGNQLSLATFIGTFVYAITVLRTVRAEDEVAPDAGHAAAQAAASALPGFVPQLALLVAYMLMAIAVGVLVYFLNHVPASIRINTVIKGIGRRLVDQVRAEYPDLDSGQEPSARPGGVPVAARHIGYVQLIDFGDLEQAARDHDRDISLRVRTGDFVHPGVPLADVAGGCADDDLETEILDSFILGATRTPTQDPDFLIDELAEIALRALSPGINDPFTAVTAIHWIGAATAEFGRRDLRKVGTAQTGGRRVYPLPDDFGHFVRRGFGVVRSAAATHPVAAKVLFDTLANTALTLANPQRVELLRGEAQALLAQAREALAGPDRAEVERRHSRFVETVG